MTGRSIEKWVGSTPDAKPPIRVRLRVFERYGGICQRTGRKIRAGDKWEVDHCIALINGGANAETNLQPVLAEAHREKTREDVAVKSKVARMKAKHLGLKTPKTRGLSKPANAKYDWSLGRYVRASNE
jgi:hypothetical protein